MGTLGKAFGVAGAFVAGDRVLIDTLVQSARSYIYTTAIPPAVASACLAALQLVREGDAMRTHLRSLIDRFEPARWKWTCRSNRRQQRYSPSSSVNRSGQCPGRSACVSAAFW